MNNLNPATPIGFLMLILEIRLRRARDERGASAVEWVVISAIVVGICAIVAALLQTALEGKAGEISDEIGNQ